MLSINKYRPSCVVSSSWPWACPPGCLTPTSQTLHSAPLTALTAVMSTSQENGVDTAEDDDLSPTELELAQTWDRRRAKSLPAYPEHANTLLRALSQGCRKRVRFADALGLNLASVKHFSAAEEPRVPLHLTGLPLAPALRIHEDGGEVEARVRRCGLALERVAISCGRVHGTIRVAADAGEREKEVGVRYTLDEWQSYVDARAVPVHSLVPDRERFAFTVCAPPRPESGAAVHFALYLRGGGAEFWDNNDGQNYTLRPGHLHSA
ncbi:protein phosphatase 1 regulatory subunit 3G [Colossoma macropomum]|uniref:protein phosphatase 1 regulatory subunit 3G n=1 Tax=Colossoma macropomum TaxID=42526 RepID=UPI001864C41F|nr:protein phosphatase 1 regulatory subunit 3G [Colossoma macropomum]